MTDDKRFKPEDDAFDIGTSIPVDTSSRARNKTVMLTPEITGQVRARLSRADAGRGMDLVHEPLGRGSNPISRQVVEQEVAPLHEAAPALSERSETIVPPQYDPPSAQHHYEEAKTIIAPPPPVESVKVTSHQEPVAVIKEEVPMVEENKVVWVKKTAIVGMLVSYDVDPLGEVYLLRTGRLVVSTQTVAGTSTLVIVDETVSNNHAIMRISDQGDIQVLDQLSEYGTSVLKQTGEELRLSGEKAVLGHGDILRFGNRSFKVCLVA